MISASIQSRAVGYILIMHSKIISIMIVMSINDNKSIVDVFWIFAILKLLCILSHLHVLYSAQQYPGIYYYLDKKSIIFITIMDFYLDYLII